MSCGTTSMDELQTSSRSEFGSLIPSLTKVLERVGEGRLELSVSVCDTVEVQVLKNRVRVLESELEAEKAIRIRAENLFADESYLNNLLIDLCREHGVQVPQYMFKRKKS